MSNENNSFNTSGIPAEFVQKLNEDLQQAPVVDEEGFAVVQQPASQIVQQNAQPQVSAPVEVQQPVQPEPTVATPEPTPVAQPASVAQPKPVAPMGQHISSTFTELTRNASIETPDFDKITAEKAEDKNKHSVEALLSNVVIDLNNIEITSGTEIDLSIAQNELAGNRRSMFVVACQSSYGASVSGLRQQEIQNITESNLDLYSMRKRVFKTVHQNIQSTTVGKMDFTTWAKVTSYFDADTFFYALYCQTFLEKGEYDLGCPKCRAPFKKTLAHTALVETRGKEEIFAKIDEVVNHHKNPSELIKTSHVHTTKRIALDDSKIIIDIFIPSIHDYLEGNLAKLNGDLLEEFGSSASMAMFVKNLMIPNIAGFRTTGKLTYLPVENKLQVIDIIANLSAKDGNYLIEQINEFTDRYRVTYALQNVVCPKCDHEIPRIPINIENQLFLSLNEL